MKLKKVTIHKYKSIETDQSFEVNDKITVLVGMNESGKTSVLEVLAKTNYFEEDKKFILNKTHDYPRREKKLVDKTGTNPKAITCTYEISEAVKTKIADDLGEGIYDGSILTLTKSYSGTRMFGSTEYNADLEKFIAVRTEQLDISSKTLNEKLRNVKNGAAMDALIAEYKDEKLVNGLTTLKKYFLNSWKWDEPLKEYIARIHFDQHLPKFLYYDEYYALPSRISIEKLNEKDLDDDELKTAKALFELAEINIDELLRSDEYENFKAELEATQAIISDTLFKYWSTNRNLEIEFNIDKKEDTQTRTVTNAANQTFDVEEAKIVEHVLDIRVKNSRSRVSLPLKNRSKGFNWFFSFLVWFQKIQEDKKSNYILLLDEPGLNLHASAQADLLKFLSDLSEDYQIIFTTHSPFMISSNALHEVRTVLETESGTVISDSVQEKDPNTLFPLQAALGYDIAQNLFVSKNNLLVEGPSDLLYLIFMSNLLEQAGRTALDEKITIVPVGGLDKVATFISLLRGSKLNIACLLDTFTDQKGKQKVTDLIYHKIIKERHIRFFDEFSSKGKPTADLEDLFEPFEYLGIFNASFKDVHPNVEEKDLDATLDSIVRQINNAIGKDRYNHYRPANTLAKAPAGTFPISTGTLDRFENLFIEMNKLFPD
jgi:predicted ATP-dependent endonuclease of OLD family